MIDVHESPVDERIKFIAARDDRFRPDAYQFFLDALDYAACCSGRREVEGRCDVSIAEVNRALHDLGLEFFGPMVDIAFHRWGVRESSDFAEIARNLMFGGLITKRDEDRFECIGGFEVDAMRGEFYNRLKAVLA